MTNQEAIEILENSTCYECAYGCNSVLDCVAECELKDAMREAIDSLEKQIPKKPVILEGNCGIFKGNKNYCCPTCSQPLYELESDGYYQVLYPTCECGQRIDWSEEC